MTATLFFNLFIFFLGLIAGSFLNCVIYRLETNESFLGGRSFCPKCRHQLAFYDLIPILSFLVLKGKCRYCRQKISWQYPLVELTAAILFVLILNYQLGILNYEFLGLYFILDTLFLILIASSLIIIFVSDLKHYIIPDKIIYPAIAITLIYNIIYSLFLIHNSKFLIDSLFSAFGAAAFFLLIVLVSRGKWMGTGDIKLAFLMGLILGFPEILVALFLAFFVGAIIGLGLVAVSKKTFKSEVPFGPFLIIGTFVGLFWGEKIVNWYLNFFT